MEVIDLIATLSLTVKVQVAECARTCVWGACVCVGCMCVCGVHVCVCVGGACVCVGCMCVCGVRVCVGGACVCVGCMCVCVFTHAYSGFQMELIVESTKTSQETSLNFGVILGS